MRTSRVATALLLCVCGRVSVVSAQETVYRVSVPQPEHHWLQVEATFSSIRAPLELRMSRSSPGRYALHEFAKNVYDVHAFDADGGEIPMARSDPYGWTVSPAGTSVRVTYKVFGDRLDGTYLAVNAAHAHMNMPATFMWARGMADRPIRVSFAGPSGATWKIATQLFASSDPLTFTAPNLQYFMDSPTEFGFVREIWFSSGSEGGQNSRRFRIALHDEGTDQDAKTYAAGVEKIVAEERAIFGEYPEYEPGAYTFLADFLPSASGDGMEHRNSTVMTGRANLSTDRGMGGALDTAAHEFFHSWNVERIRPASLEPFDFERANMSGELWLAEGFTSYYGALVMQRTGLATLRQTLANFGSAINWVVNHPATRTRTAVEVSQMAPFVDAPEWVDPTNFDITFLSYYTWGEGIALALDLSLREMTNGRVTLDDYMRAMWRSYGRPGGSAPGLVSHPYTLDDARQQLGQVSGNGEFARAFFSQYIEGHHPPDYARLLRAAGLVLRQPHAGRAWFGHVSLQGDPQGARLTSLTAPGWPAYQAGLDEGDVIASLDGHRIGSAEDLSTLLGGKKPGDDVRVEFLRGGVHHSASVKLAEDPSLEVVTLESTGATPSAAQQQFRDAWLASRVTIHH